MNNKYFELFQNSVDKLVRNITRTTEVTALAMADCRESVCNLIPKLGDQVPLLARDAPHMGIKLISDTRRMV